MKVSVVIPVYNRSDLISQTIETVLAQKEIETEIIVVDDGSTDNTVQILKRDFSAKIKLVQIQNSGPGAARNAGLSIATGEFIQFLDSDDLILPHKLVTQVKALEDSGKDIAIGPWIKTEINDQSLTFDSKVFQGKGLPNGLLAKRLICDWAIMLQPCLFRHRLVQKVGGLPEHLRSPEDQAFLLKCLLAGGEQIYTPNTLVLYRVGHEGQLTGSGLAEKKREQEWARYLIWARQEFLRSELKKDPMHWAPFRQRLYNSQEYLKKFGDVELAEQIGGILRKHLSNSSFDLAKHTRKLIQLRTLFRQLVSGHRENSTYRMSGLSQLQKDDLIAAGYEFQ